MNLKHALEDNNVTWLVTEDCIEVYVEDKYTGEDYLGKIVFKKNGVAEFLDLQRRLL